MVLPIGDAPNPRGFAVVNALLIAANVAVFALVTLPLGSTPADPRDPLVLEYARTMARALGERVSWEEILSQATAYDLVVFRFGFRPVKPSVVDLFTCMFLHGGFLHLLGNMLFLWIYGDNVEHAMGRFRYLLAYLGTGVAATALHWACSPQSAIPLVGASGAISGILGLYFLWFARNKVRLLWLVPPFVMQVFEVPARFVLGMYLVLDNIVPFFAAPSDGGVAHGAHIGGFFAGLALAWLLDRRDLAARPAKYRSASASGSAGRASARTIQAAIADGRLEDAAADYFSLSPRSFRGAMTPEDSLQLARGLRSRGQADAALASLRRAIRHAPGGAAAALHLEAGLVLLEDLGEPALAFQHLRAVLEEERNESVDRAARRALAEIDGLQKRRIGRLHRPHPW